MDTEIDFKARNRIVQHNKVNLGENSDTFHWKWTFSRWHFERSLPCFRTVVSGEKVCCKTSTSACTFGSMMMRDVYYCMKKTVLCFKNSFLSGNNSKKDNSTIDPRTTLNVKMSGMWTPSHVCRIGQRDHVLTQDAQTTLFCQWKKCWYCWCTEVAVHVHL